MNSAIERELSMSKKRVAIIGTTGLPARYGGFETLAHHLVDQLGSRYDISVYCSSKYFADRGKRLSVYNGARLIYLPLNANGYQSIPYDIFSIIHAIRKNDVLLLLGVSGAILLPFLKLFTNKPILVNIDGQEWKRPKWNWLARKVLGFSEKLAVRFADEVIADNKVIQQYVEQSYGRDNARLIEYGGDHVSKRPLTDKLLDKYPFLNQNYAFNVSRIEPENNIHVILQAFSKAPRHQLVMVGLWSHGKYGMNLKAQYSKFSNIHLLDPIYNQEELNEIRSNAGVYVHGHSAGGTNPGLVEAMCLGLPVVSYDISYNRETTNHRARYFKSASDLLSILDVFDEKERMRMGCDLEQYGRQYYSWNRIASLYAAAFDGDDDSTGRLLYRSSQSFVEQIQLLTGGQKVKIA
jgi:glycosyltransferase involved in cell wall biosynthesis